MKQIACHYCDLLLSGEQLIEGQTAVCPRCGQVIYYDTTHNEFSIALLIAGLLIYFPAVLLPFLSMEISGQTQNVSLVSSLVVVYKEGNYLLATAVFLLVVVAPIIRLFGLLLLLLPYQFDMSRFMSKKTIEIIAHLAPWNMVEVYLIGVIVTIVKLHSMAAITLSIGFFAFCVFIIINAFISISLPNKKLWQIIIGNK